jgi:hypothetical protein
MAFSSAKDYMAAFQLPVGIRSISEPPASAFGTKLTLVIEGG